MNQLEKELLLQAIRNNPEFASKFAQGRVLGSAARQTLTGIGNMADDANRIFGLDEIAAAGVKALPKSARKGAMGIIRSAPMRFAGKALPILGALGVATDLGDLVTGNESLGNKAMDATAMGIGGTIGAAVGLGNPLVAATGATLGKTASDGIQFLLGGGKSAEQRKLEEALQLLQQRGVI